MTAASPLHRNAQIQLATNLDAVDRSDEAIKGSRPHDAENGKDIEAIALGNIERAREKFADCSDTYTKGIDALVSCQQLGAVLLPRHLLRALGKWGKSTDLKKALELKADLAACAELSRLFVDRSRASISTSMKKMIRRAVRPAPG